MQGKQVYSLRSTRISGEFIMKDLPQNMCCIDKLYESNKNWNVLPFAATDPPFPARIRHTKMKKKEPQKFASKTQL